MLNSSNPMIKVWVTRGNDNVLRVAVIHKDVNATSSAVISLTVKDSSTETAGTGQLSIITVPNATTPRDRAASVGGVTWAGQTWDGTTDGSLVGTKSYVTVDNINAVYTFNVDAVTMNLLEIPIKQKTVDK